MTDVILSKNQKQLYSAIPVIKTYDQKLNALNQWWEKITLVGKINSQRVAPNILDEMQSTRKKFSDLQQHLVHNLLKEHLQKRISDDHNKSQVAIDILIRNLFERTADVGFLATDEDIRNFLLKPIKQSEDKQEIRLRLEEYVKKYSIYNDIIILDCDGVVQANLDPNNIIKQSDDSLIKQTLNSSEDYVETFRHSDLQAKQPQSLIYSCAIKSSNEQNAEILGVLCLCFRFVDEMQSIFADLQTDNTNSHIMIIDENGKAIASSNEQHFPIGSTFSKNQSTDIRKINDQLYLSTVTATKGYQGFFGLGWSGQVLTPLQKAFNHDEEKQDAENELLDLQSSQLFSAELNEINHTSVTIKDDLSLVVLNGIIASARKQAVEFMPVLQEIEKIGEGIANVFTDSLNNLQSTVVSARLSEVQFIAGLAVDIMDRNLYERANDCRWWALTTVFRQLLEQPIIQPSDQLKINDILSYINGLYTVYTNLYVYDKSSTIVGVSNPDQQHLIGQVAEDNSGATAALQITDSQQYAVSKFVPSAQYHNRHTYIYNASITSLKNNAVLGGIAVVFDSEPELSAMLEDCLPRDQAGKVIDGCFALYCQRDGLIVSVTEHSPQQVGQTLDITPELFTLDNGLQESKIINYQGKSYAIGIAASKGYREYKTTGDYENDILSFVMIPS